MVGIVVVSHSQKLSEGVVEVAKMMAEDAPIAAAGGMDDGELGTSYERIQAAVESVYSEDGVVLLADMGSAVMTAEIVLEDLELDNVIIVDCPLVEGAILAAIDSVGGRDLQMLVRRLESAHSAKKFGD